ncbi:DUF3103 family protein [Roseivirga sp. BDSF3-8]|uniref:DUF3103 family protein n=1 Tax=Roseivirga sp. BDSF3-8 TaxID=3241598 RepID=UPI00353198CF
MLFNQPIKKITLAVLGVIIAFGCQEEFQEPATPNPLPAATYTTQDRGYALAQALATAMASQELRHFVKQKIDQRFDGDANFLYALQEQQPVSEGEALRSLTFGQALFGKDQAGQRRARSLEAEPLLQIALRKPPGVTKDWDPAREHPVVVYLPYGTDARRVSTLPAFDSQGHYIDFQVDKLPTEPILVISHNERVRPVPRHHVDKLRHQAAQGQLAPDDGCILTTDPILVTDDAYYYMTTDLNCGGTGGYVPGGLDGGSGTNDTQDDCDRDGSPLYDHISRVKFVNMKEFKAAENYLDGAPEVYFFVFTGSNQAHLQSFRKNIPLVDRSEWKDCPLLSDCYTEWHYPDLEVMFWDKEEFGEILEYQWFEADNGDPIKFTTTVNKELDDGTTLSSTLEVTVSDNDYNLGNALVYFCEDATQAAYKLNETGSLDFALELR